MANEQALWREIDKLKREIRTLKERQARRTAIIANNPKLLVGDIIETGETAGNRTYKVQERTVDAQKEEIYTEVRTLPDDPGPQASEQPVAFYYDGAGNRYILPNAHRLILVQDQGAGQGRHVEKSAAGVVTTPPGSEILGMVIAEPTGFFHNASPPIKAGRIYPGFKIVDPGGINKAYLVFVAGFGDVAITISDSTTVVAGSTLTFQVDVDGQGNVINVNLF